MQNTITVRRLIWLFPAFLLFQARAFCQFTTLGKWKQTPSTRKIESASSPKNIDENKAVVLPAEAHINQWAMRVSSALKTLVITSSRGMRRHPLHGRYVMHERIDLKARYEPVFAVMDGTVEGIGNDDVSGSWIRLMHGNGLRTSYAHLSQINVMRGQTVLCGQPIGILGKSGRITGCTCISG